jgi:RNA polymerase sigma-70 factor (ECF subfamily)
METNPTSDATLLARVAQADEGALLELYDRYAPFVAAMARRMLQDPDDIHESVQNIFVAVWQRAPQIDTRRVPVSTWLIMLAQRHLLTQVIGRPVEMFAFNNWDVPNREVFDLADEAQHKHLKHAVATLSSEERELLELALFQGCSYRELAQATSKPLRTITTTLRTSLARLHSYLRGKS